MRATEICLRWLVTVIGLFLLSFLFLWFLPGDGLGEDVAPARREQWRVERGLDVSPWVALSRHTSDLWSHGGGVSWSHPGRTVRSVIQGPGRLSLNLGMKAILLGLHFSLLLLLLAPRVSAKTLQRLWNFFDLLLTPPTFVVGAVLVGWIGRMGGVLPGQPSAGGAGQVLPVLILAWRPFLWVARTMVRGVQQALTSPLSQGLAARGLSPAEVIWHHSLGRILAPILPNLASLTADLLMGSFVVELLFGVRGLGFALYEAIGERDLPLLLGLVVLVGLALATLQMLVSLLKIAVHPALDRVPR